MNAIRASARQAGATETPRWTTLTDQASHSGKACRHGVRLSDEDEGHAYEVNRRLDDLERRHKKLERQMKAELLHISQELQQEREAREQAEERARSQARDFENQLRRLTDQRRRFLEDVRGDLQRRLQESEERAELLQQQIDRMNVQGTAQPPHAQLQARFPANIQTNEPYAPLGAGLVAAPNLGPGPFAVAAPAAAAALVQNPATAAPPVPPARQPAPAPAQAPAPQPRVQQRTIGSGDIRCLIDDCPHRFEDEEMRNHHIAFNHDDGGCTCETCSGGAPAPAANRAPAPAPRPAPAAAPAPAVAGPSRAGNQQAPGPAAAAPAAAAPAVANEPMQLFFRCAGGGDNPRLPVACTRNERLVDVLERARAALNAEELTSQNIRLVFVVSGPNKVAQPPIAQRMQQSPLATLGECGVPSGAEIYVSVKIIGQAVAKD
eukprot:tig00000123_g6924.t1